MADYDKAYNKSLFSDGAGAGVSPSWMPGGSYGGVPMGGGSSKKRLRISKLRKLNTKSKKNNKKFKKTMRKMKRHSKKH